MARLSSRQRSLLPGDHRILIVSTLLVLLCLVIYVPGLPN